MNNLSSNTLFLPILLVMIFLIISIAPSQSEEPASVSCDAENATAQITKNIGFLLPMLETQNGSKTATYGVNESKVYGLSQCIGNVSNQTCQSCIKNAIDVIPGRCKFQSGASIWYDYCLLRYSNISFYGESGGWPDLVLVNSEKVTGFKDFNKALTELMKNTTDEATSSPNGFGSGSIKIPGDHPTGTNIYGLLQCNKDLIDPAHMKCGQCLDVAKSYLDKGCRNHKGCRVFVKGCFLRYELYTFFYNSTGTSAAGNYYEYVKDVIKD